MTNYLTVKDIQDKMKLSRTNAYKLINLNGFPKITIGRKILIPEDRFEKYMECHLKGTINI